VMSTHLVDEARRLDRIVMMHRGSVIADDAPDALCHDAGSLRLIVRSPDWSPDRHRDAMGDTDDQWRRVASRWSRPIDAHELDRAGSIAESLASQGVAFELTPPTLADVFELLTGATLDDSHPSRRADADDAGEA